MTRNIIVIGLMLSAAILSGCSGGSSGNIGGGGVTSSAHVDDNRPYVDFASYGGTANVLDVVDDLQRTAKASGGGSLGCGAGTITINTSQGVQTVATGLDPIHVFGQNIDIAVVHELLESRAASNRTGKRGPMSKDKDVDALCSVALSTVELAKDPESVPLLVELRNDESEIVQFHAQTALRAIAAAHPKVQAELETGSSVLPP